MTAKTTTTRKQSSGLLEVRGDGLPGSMLEAKAAIEAGRMEAALALLDATTERQLKQLLERDPSRVDALKMMGMLLQRLGQDKRASVWFERVLEHTEDVGACLLLADTHHAHGRFDRATDYRLRAVLADPENRDTWLGLAYSLVHEGRIAAGLDWFQRVVDDNPQHSEAFSNLLFYQHYLPRLDRSGQKELYRQWQERCVSQVVALHPQRDRNPQRRLRIGYISGDLCRHSVAYTFEAILTSHHPEAVEVFVYSQVTKPDIVTQRIVGQVDHFRDVTRLGTVDLAQRINRDAIDILVYLAGNVDRRRLELCAYRPAPIQIDWGSMDTTAAPFMDSRLADPLLDPPEDQIHYFETLLHLPHGAICYRPPDFAPPVSSLPALQNGFITFGSCNNGMKLNERVLATWARILAAVPNSRLLLQCAGADCPRIQQRLMGPFVGMGVDPQRILLQGWLSSRAHLDMYHQIDIALDPFPFNGAVSTLEALWMGVPVVTLAGRGFIERTGQAVLTRLGLPGLCAADEATYVTKAVALAQNTKVLAKMRGGLRTCLAASPVCDPSLHVTEFETAYRDLWQNWCRGTQGGAAEEVIEFAFFEQGPLTYRVDKRDLPAGLLDVLAATETGNIENAKDYLDEELVQSVTAWADSVPERTDLCFLMGLLYRRLDEPEAARAWYQRHVDQEAHPLVYAELASLAQRAGHPSQAIVAVRQALAAAPDHPALLASLAEYQLGSGQQAEGLMILKQLVDRPDSHRIIHSKYLWHLHHQDRIDPEAIYAEHRQWAQQHAPKTLARQNHQRDRSPDRPLRIGYISGDFRSHSVAYFLESLLDGHDQDQVKVYGYGNVPGQDVVTERLQAKCDTYRNIYGVDDTQVCTWIEEDQIDILVDLSGHTGDNRLGVIARRPAPIQVNCIGYADTTGMDQVDYRLTDAWADGPAAQTLHSEQLVRLESGFICYSPPGFAPPVAELPALRTGQLTLGSFNNGAKIVDTTLDLWGRILAALPQSRLVLKFNGAEDAQVRASYTERFQQRGIQPERFELVGRLPVMEHFELYHQVDLSLDTFPYHGTTTTCEALWMGVPVLSLVGETHVSRVGLSLLTRVGLEVFACQTADEYVAKAVSFGTQLEHLATIRKGLRANMAHSPLCDKRGYTKCVEEAYRDMWKQWIEY